MRPWPAVMKGLLQAAGVILVAAAELHCGGGGAQVDPAAIQANAPSQLAYPQPVLAGVVGQPLVPDQPTVKGAGISYAVTPTLPAGLTLDPALGTLAGTPVAVLPATPYLVTATNADGFTTATVQISVGAATGSQYSYLICPLQIQAHSEWCWAATGASVLDFLNLPQTQCAIVDYVRNITDACGNPEFNWTDPVANEAIQALYGPPPSVSDLMAHFGAPCTGQASALTYAELQTEINAGRPFIVNWAWASGGGHILVGCGWDTTLGQEVSLMDPWPNEGFKVVDYTWLCSGTDSAEDPASHAWDWTLTLNPN